MATIEFVTALITLWNERVEYHNSNPFPIGGSDFKPQKKSIEGFKEFMAGQTVTVLNNQTFYYYVDVSRYLHGGEVVD